MRRALVFAVLLPPWLLSPARAGVLAVPADYPSITEALAASRAGDEIHVAAGTYSRTATRERFPLELSGKDVTLQGAGAGKCVLDGEGATGIFRVTAGNSSAIAGFTLRGGHAADGGALHIEAASPEIARVHFTENRAGRRGDVVVIRGGQPRLSNSLFVANGAYGPVVLVESGSPLLEHNTFHGNAGPALEVRNGASPTFRNNIVSAPGARGGESVGIRIVTGGSGDAPLLSRNLFAGCDLGAVVVRGKASPLLEAALDDARREEGLREGDPRFLAPNRFDFRLEETSPARLRGSEIGAYGGLEALRGWAAPNRPGDRSEEGAPSMLGPSVPNPFRPQTTIHFTVQGFSVVDLGVYNVLGQRIRTLHAGDLSPGEHSRVWDGRDDVGVDSPPGIYFVRVTQGSVTESRRLVLVR